MDQLFTPLNENRSVAPNEPGIREARRLRWIWGMRSLDEVPAID